MQIIHRLHRFSQMDKIGSWCLKICGICGICGLIRKRPHGLVSADFCIL